MTTSAPSTWLLGAALLLPCLLQMASGQADVSPNTYENDFLLEASIRANFDNDSFLYNFGSESNAVGSAAGIEEPMFVNNNKALGSLPGLGIGQNRITLQPCAVELPHVHPRGTTVGFVIYGNITYGFLEENAGGSGNATYGGRYFTNVAPTGSSFIVPQGLLHFTQNAGCEEAQFVTSFPTRDPSAQAITNNLFRLPPSVLRASFGLSDTQLATVTAAALGNNVPLAQDPVCLAACGLSASPANGAVFPAAAPTSAPAANSG